MFNLILKTKEILRNTLLFKFLFWIWIVGILIFSSIPGLPVPEKDIINIFRSDYLIHLLEYLFLAFFFVFWQQNELDKIRKILLVLVIGIGIGIIDELHQIFIPGRSFNFIDMILNISGFSIGLLISLKLLLIIFNSKNGSNRIIFEEKSIHEN